MSWGTPRFGSDRKPYPQALKDGDNIHRVLPPIHTAADKGVWASPCATHTCSTPKAGGDGKKRNWYTYFCVEKVTFSNGEKIVTQRCAKCDEIAAKKAEYEALQADVKQQVKDGVLSKQAASETLKPYVNWFKRNSRDFKYNVNAKLQDGTFGTFKYPAGVKKDIETIAEKFGKLRVPWSPILAHQGLWLNIVKTPADKTGSGFPEYKAEVVQDEVVKDGDTFMLPKKAPLSEEDYNAALEKCLDLNDVGYRKLTPEQVQAIVDANEEPEILDAIFKQSDKRGSAEGSPAPRGTTTTTPRTASQPEQRNGPTPSQGASNSTPPTPPKKQEMSPDDAAALRARARALLAEAEAKESKQETPPKAANEPMAKVEQKPSTAGSSGNAAASSAPPKADSAPAGDDDLGFDPDFFAQFDVG
jgi:hypothetical protein